MSGALNSVVGGLGGGQGGGLLSSVGSIVGGIFGGPIGAGHRRRDRATWSRMRWARPPTRPSIILQKEDGLPPFLAKEIKKVVQDAIAESKDKNVTPDAQH